MNEVTLSDEINSYTEAKKYMILHTKSSEKHLTSLKIDEEKLELSANLTEITPFYNYYKPDYNKKNNKYKKKLGKPYNEVHLYTNQDINLGDIDKISLPLSNIDSIIVYDKALGKTIAQVTLGVIGALVVATAIVALTKSSCPFVYAYNGKSFDFEGELYPGATRKNLERDDYLCLNKLKEKNGLYTIKISNELKEIQYTNLVQLIEVKHDINQSVLTDDKGNIYSISNPIPPENIYSNSIDISTSPLLFKDHNSYLFDKPISNSNSLSSVHLKFDKPADVSKGKLVLNLKNSYWLDYVFGKFNEKFGSYYNTFQENQRLISGEKGMQWMINQGIPLSVSIKKSGSWEFVQYLNVVGPLASRDLIVPIDLNNINETSISVKLECGFMFWEIDYAAMDYSLDQPLEISILNPIRAIDENGKDVKNSLLKSDNSYLVQSKIGSTTTVSFKCDSTINENSEGTTLFLKNRGYYEYIRDYKGIPDFVELRTFREKGAFTNFSKQEYYKFLSHPDMLDLIVYN